MSQNCKSSEIRKMMYGLHTLVEINQGKEVPAINLDNAATTPPFKEVLCEIEYQMLYYGSIGRGKGQKSEHSTNIYSEGREVVKDFLGANSEEYTVVYTNCTTDGMNKLASALIKTSNDLVLTTRMEHHANDLPWRERAQVVYAEVDDKGRLSKDETERLLKKHGGKIKIVSVTAASNVTGYVNDVHGLARLAHKYGAEIVVDGAQIVAHQEFSMLGDEPEADIDYFLFSAHKMYSPFGGGAIVGRMGVLNGSMPHFWGGGMVQAVCDNEVVYADAPDLYEAGSPNYPGIVGMIVAMEILKEIGFDYIQQHEQQLLRQTIQGLDKIQGVKLYGDNNRITDRVGIICFNIEGLSSERTADYLARYYGIATRHAAFCAHPYVRRLTGDQVKNECTAPNGMVRASFGVYTSEEEIICFINAVREIACFASANPSTSEVTKPLSTHLGKPYDRA